MKEEYCEEMSTYFIRIFEAWVKHQNLAICFCISDVHLLSHGTGLLNSSQRYDFLPLLRTSVEEHCNGKPSFIGITL